MKKLSNSNTPLKNKTAFMFYCEANRSDFQKAYPRYGKFITKKLRKSWLLLSSTDRKPFLALAEQDKKRYYEAQDKHNYGFLEDEYPPLKMPTTRKPAFMYYCEEKRSAVKKAYPHFTIHQVTEKLSDMWTSLAPEQRMEYEEQADIDFLRCQMEKEYEEQEQKLNADFSSNKCDLQKTSKKRKNHEIELKSAFPYFPAAS